MPRLEFFDEPSLRRRHITEMVGIAPDGRPVISTAEQRELIEGTQAGSADYSRRLIACRLLWLYDRFAADESLAGLSSLDTAELMQLGCVATLEAAHQVNVVRAEAVNLQQVYTVDHIDAWLDGLRQAGQQVPLRASEVDSQRTIELPSVEREVFGNAILAKEALADFIRLYRGPFRDVEIFTDYYLAEETLSIQQLAQKHRISETRVGKILNKVRNTIWSAGSHRHYAPGLAAGLSADEPANEGLIPDPYEPRLR